MARTSQIISRFAPIALILTATALSVPSKDAVAAPPEPASAAKTVNDYLDAVGALTSKQAVALTQMSDDLDRCNNGRKSFCDRLSADMQALDAVTDQIVATATTGCVAAHANYDFLQANQEPPALLRGAARSVAMLCTDMPDNARKSTNYIARLMKRAFPNDAP